MTRLKTTVERCIHELIRDYKDNELSYLTESDVVASLLSLLRMRLDSDSVHCELRPYDSKKRYISGKPHKWKKEARGCLVDIVILKKQGLKRVIRERQRRYWRYLSFPVASFRASVEVKIRTWRNKRNIRADIDKLNLILRANPRCLVYLVVLDRYAPEADLMKVRDYAQKYKVGFFSYPPSR
ncbi:MAG: hypothetical protein KAR39_06805 [Thermoplasmata archaeon]|nr:hypothetical protein [Thermoplasmata archaeon]